MPMIHDGTSGTVDGTEQTRPKEALDPYAKPPENVRIFYKRFQKLKLDDLANAAELLDPHRNEQKQPGTLHQVDILPTERINTALNVWHGISMSRSGGDLRVYEDTRCPGLLIIPGALDVHAQALMLDRLLHRDLTNPAHKTNVHLHHHLTYPPLGTSFFSKSRDPLRTYQPKDANVHKPLSIDSLLQRKLRWMTLGGQYDWTQKVYPKERPPPFPEDIGRLLQALWPAITPEAAICNLYTPGDTLSMHRDVSEECEAPLLSLSIGCDAIFVISASNSDENGAPQQRQPMAIRLRSGDMVVMSGLSRFTWHGVPQVIPDTCPRELEGWPASMPDGTSALDETGYEQWRGWMKRKRINLNVRQMYHGTNPD